MFLFEKSSFAYRPLQTADRRAPKNNTMFSPEKLFNVSYFFA